MIDSETGLPIVPHEFAEPNVNCCGCLIVQDRGELADLVCNECSVIVKTLPADQAMSALTEMAWSTGEVASATCPHCGSVNVRPGFSELLGFICSECGKGVAVEKPGT
jgi:hypothetical protein